MAIQQIDFGRLRESMELSKELRKLGMIKPRRKLASPLERKRARVADNIHIVQLLKRGY